MSVGALAGRSIWRSTSGPCAASPLHDWHLANGAAMIEAGPWLRRLVLPLGGRDRGTAYVEEMRLVRTTVGLSDVSTLGKIDVQGPDAAEFLNRVYVNGFAKLPVGKARYGVMLNDDATVLDDGTTARFGRDPLLHDDDHGAGGRGHVLLEFLLQTAWAELKVQVVLGHGRLGRHVGRGAEGPRRPGTCIPEHRSVRCLAPSHGLCASSRSRASRCESCASASRASLPTRSTFLPATAWRCGRGSSSAGAALGIRPYGLESLASLRIEKGHVAGLELDHRNTLDDLGLGKMASRTKAYVGRELRVRAELIDPERWSLVGLECLEPSSQLRGGAILFSREDEVRGHGRGYTTSVTWSTVLGKLIALGLYRGGLRHEGEEILCAYPLLGETVRARIVSPVFVDAAGVRLHV